MKLSTVLFSSAALLATGVVAQAADLPSKKAAPVEYVRVCSTYGAGFFYIPGTDTCIRIGGRARFEYQYTQPEARNDPTTGSRAIGRVYLDARTATEYGLLRAYVRYDIMRRIGATLYSGTGVRSGQAFTGSSVDFNGQAQTGVYLDRAFVQFGGLTAGRTQSFFEFYAGDLELGGVTAGSALTTNLLAYTATFGGGFSGSLSIEDSVERRNAIKDRLSPALGASTTGNQYAYTGSSVPDVVANLRLDQGWGSVQLSGALHQVRVGQYTMTTDANKGIVGIGNAGDNGIAPEAKFGYAVNLGVKFNLPMLAAGDALYLQGTYTKGASSYIISNPFGWGKAGWNVGQAQWDMPDATLVSNGAGGATLAMQTVYGGTAAMLHYWTPTVRQALFASYIKSDLPSSAYLAGLTAGGVATPWKSTAKDATYWALGTNVIWSPIKDLDIGAEVEYVHASIGQGGVNSAVKTDPTGPTKIIKSDGSLLTRLRIQRDF